MYQALFTYLTPPNLPLVSTPTGNLPHRHPEKFDTAEDVIMRHTYCQAWLRYTDRNREVWSFVDVQKKAFPFLLHFLFNFSLFSSYFLIAKCLKDACESVENIPQEG